MLGGIIVSLIISPRQVFGNLVSHFFGLRNGTRQTHIYGALGGAHLRHAGDLLIALLIAVPGQFRHTLF